MAEYRDIEASYGRVRLSYPMNTGKRRVVLSLIPLGPVPTVESLDYNAAKALRDALNVLLEEWEAEVEADYG